MLGIIEVMPVAGRGDVDMQLRLRRKDEKCVKAAVKAIGLRVTGFIVRAFLQRAEDVERRVYVSKLTRAFAALMKAEEPFSVSCPSWRNSSKRRKAFRKAVYENGANGRSKIDEIHGSGLQSAGGSRQRTES